jgi:hypothetical protein
VLDSDGSAAEELEEEEAPSMKKILFRVPRHRVKNIFPKVPGRNLTNKDKYKAGLLVVFFVWFFNNLCLRANAHSLTMSKVLLQGSQLPPASERTRSKKKVLPSKTSEKEMAAAAQGLSALVSGTHLPGDYLPPAPDCFDFEELATGNKGAVGVTRVGQMESMNSECVPVSHDQDFVVGNHYCLVFGRLFFSPHPDVRYTIETIKSDAKTFYFSSELPGNPRNSRLLPLSDLCLTVQFWQIYNKLTMPSCWQRDIPRFAPTGGLSTFLSSSNSAGAHIIQLH